MKIMIMLFILLITAMGTINAQTQGETKSKKHTGNRSGGLYISCKLDTGKSKPIVMILKKKNEKELEVFFVYVFTGDVLKHFTYLSDSTLAEIKLTSIVKIQNSMNNIPLEEKDCLSFLGGCDYTNICGDKVKAVIDIMEILRKGYSGLPASFHLKLIPVKEEEK